MSFTQYLSKVAKISLIAIVIIFGIRTFLIEPGRIQGRSMENSLFDNQFFLVDKVSFFFRNPQRGEIIQLIDSEHTELRIKRIIGLPGEILSIRDSKVFLLDQEGSEYRLPEAYLPDPTITKAADGDFSYPQLGDYEYFVMGDQRANSIDSRDFGPVHRSQITGRVMAF